MKTFTNITSNHHSDQVLTNALLRTQAREQLHQQPLKSSADGKIFKNISLVKGATKRYNYTIRIDEEIF